MKIIFKYFIIGLLLFAFACKNKKSTDKSVQKAQLEFKDKFHQANSEKMIGHYERAVVLFNECLVIKPKSAACFFGLSQIYISQNESEKGLSNAEQAYEINPKNKWYLVHLADLYFGVGNYHKSATLYSTLFSDFEETNIEYRYKLVESLIYSNQNEDAIEQLDLIELETGKSPEISLTKHDLYNNIGKPNNATGEIESLLIEYPGNEEIRVTILDYYLQTNQIEKAAAMAEEILIINPKNGNAHLGLADVEIRKNHIDKSFDYLEIGFQDKTVNPQRKMALLSGLTSYALDKKDPNSSVINSRLDTLFKIENENQSLNPDFLLIYATFLDYNNQKIQAREKFKSVTVIDPSNYNGWDALLNINYELNQFDSLYINGNEALEYFPAQPIIYLLAGIGAYESKRFDKAEELLFLGKDLVIKDNSLISEFQYHTGKMHWHNNDKEEAKKYFDKALITEPGNAKVYNGYALFLLKDSEFEQAEVQIKKAIAIDSKNEFYLDTYGQILIKLKKYTSAIETLESAVTINYENAEILEHYGDALFLSGQTKNGLEMWKEALKQVQTQNIQYKNIDTLNKKITDKKYYEN